MGLLSEIQEAVIGADSDLGPILLKLRLLASRLGSAELEEWVKHESEGYPDEVEVPEYRKLNASYHGDFFGPWGASIKNARIPSILVEKFADSSWTKVEMRQSIAAIDDLAGGKEGKKGGMLLMDASNLIFALEGKVYPQYTCHSVTGEVAKSSMREIQHAVRNRILELTIKIEKEVPAAKQVTFGARVDADAGIGDRVTQIVNQIVHHGTAVASTGTDAQISVNISEGDKNAVVEELVKAGVPNKAAEEFAKVLGSEEPESGDKPFGKRAREWLGKNLPMVAEGAWNITLSVATKVLEAAAKKFYGLE